MLYLHVGLPKTGTTFMQAAVFPRWQGIVYSSSADLEYFTSIDFNKVNLISNEALIAGPNYLTQPQRLASMERLSKLFPDARILISFRRHSRYIVSCYRQYLQRGGVLSFDKYFDIELDRGLINKSELQYQTEIDAVKAHFRHEPFTFTQEEIRSNLPGLLAALEGFIGGKAPEIDQIEVKAYNKSVGYYPAYLLRTINRMSRSEFNPGGRFSLYSRRMMRLRLDPRSICQYWLAFLPDREFIPSSLRARIDDYFHDDWEYVQTQVRNRQ